LRKVTAGIVVSAVVSLLVVLSLIGAPVSMAKAKSKRITCIINLKQIGLACRRYAAEREVIRPNPSGAPTP